jgi:hypothetical protein
MLANPWHAEASSAEGDIARKILATTWAIARKGRGSTLQYVRGGLASTQQRFIVLQMMTTALRCFDDDERSQAGIMLLP